MIREAKTYTDNRIYNRIPEVHEKVRESLRTVLRTRAIEEQFEIDWNTEEFEEVLEVGSRKCEDKLLITLKVDTFNRTLTKKAKT